MAAVAESMMDVVDDYMSTDALDDKSEDVESVQFDFDESYQARIAALCMRDKNFMKRVAHLIQPGYFDALADKILVGIALQHFEKYDGVLADPSVIKMALSDAIKRREIRDDEKSVVISRVKELSKLAIDNPDYAVEKVATFAKRQAIEIAMTKSIDFFEKGDFDRVEQLMEQAFKVGEKANGEVYNYFEESKNRRDHREKIASGIIKRRGLPLGVPEFDNLLHHRGFGYGELTVYMAAAKRGKTTAMWDAAKRWSLMGYNVLGITLEVSSQILSDRMDANIAGVKMSDLAKHYDDVEERLEKVKGRAGALMIHEYPSNSLRPMDVDNLIEDYRSQGIHFDAVVVDYLDIMAPNKWMPNDIANSKSVWSDMRGVAQKHDVVMLSATQTNRDGAGKATADDTDVAEDYNKIRIADLVMSINSTDEELAKGEARIFFAASRNQRGKFSVVIKNNMECMQFMTQILDIL